MKIIIRPETPSEYNEVDNVIYEAFSGQHGIETGKFMKRHFADERRKDTYIPELSLVAVLENEKIVGEVAIHETDIITDKGNVTELTLSQCAVLPEYRKQGIMRMLVEEGLKIAKTWDMERYFLVEIQCYILDLDLSHLINMEFIIKIEKNGVMKDLWCIY